MARERTRGSIKVRSESRGMGIMRVERDRASSSTGLLNALARAAKTTVDLRMSSWAFKAK